MAQDIDTSVFSKMAELLARPLSPTALEKEEQQAKSAGGTPSSVRSKGQKPQPQRTPARARSTSAARPGKAEAKAKASARAQAAAEAPADEQSTPTCQTTDVVIEPTEPHSGGGILSAVSELSGLQQEWKDKIKSPSHRKAGPPRMKKPEQKILSEQERQQKMGEIDSLEEELAKAKGVAAAAKAAAAAAEKVAAASAAEAEALEEDAESDAAGDGKKNDEGHLDLARQAEDRVKARKRQEAKERRDRERREVAESKARQAEAEAKQKELERLTKERVQERLRAERAREQSQREERQRESELKEQRAQQASEELQRQALKRVSERENASRQRAEEVARQEAEARQQQKEEHEARAHELRERTRLRMQQYTQEQRERALLEEEAQRRRCLEEAQAAEEKHQQAQLSQQRARARAAEFRQRQRLEDEEKARLEEEQMAREQARSEAALQERQRKRQWRHGLDGAAAEAPLAASPTETHAPARVSSMPPRPPADKVTAGAQAPVAAEPGQVQAAASRPARAQNSAPIQRKMSGASAAAAGNGPPRGVQRVNSKKLQAGAAVKQGPANASEIALGGASVHDDVATNWSPAVDDGQTVQCTVGFFGIGNDPLDDDADEEDAPGMPDSARASQPSGPSPRVAASGYAAKAANRLPSRGSSRGSTRAPSAPAPPFPPPVSKTAMRAASQPPLTRPSRGAAQESPSGDCSRASSPGWSDPFQCDAQAPYGMPRSPGAASSFSDPETSMQPAGSPGHSSAPKSAPWKQKAIQVKSAEAYLEELKAARGLKAAQGAKGPGAKAAPRGRGYAEQVRQRASDVEVQQREEEGARMERGYAALQRVQQRGLQASPMRSMSAG
eukprot:TRINITY_DN9323_c0_g1_i2.p1 TRINITY_DN9323_c0_g1~~TRINITY_DN9323_c0_g1_i2.p1  ORF type:complete len:875 (-),score=235.34 TRINITY_DN9323_c0_g1_i2:73-2619(-)